MEWMKKHVDTVVILGGILGAVLWMNGKFNEIEREITGLKVDIAVMKTVLIMKDMMPKELAMNEDGLK